MSGALQPFHSLPYELGLGYAVEFRFDGKRLDALWSPRTPDAATAGVLMPRYRAARDLVLGAAAGAAGLCCAVLDTDDGGRAA